MEGAIFSKFYFIHNYFFFFFDLLINCLIVCIKNLNGQNHFNLMQEYVTLIF